MAGRPVVVIGSLNLDRTFQVAAFPVAGLTQTVTRYAEGVGGKGANQAAAAARMGVPTYMLGCLGQDAAGDSIATALAEAGVETSALVRTGVAPTGNAAILLTPEGENSILVVPGANHVLTPGHLRDQRDLLANAAMLLLQMETSLKVLAEALAIAGPANVPVMLDPAPASALPAELLRQLTWFTPNESEARFYLEAAGGEDGGAAGATASDALTDPAGAACGTAGLACGLARDPEAICRYFQSLGPRNVLLKLGARGAALLTGDGLFVLVSAPKVTAVDTTGAGDTLNGVLAARLALGQSEEDALRFAVAAASLSTTRPGALASQPIRREVDSFMNRIAQDSKA
jgi:ribokinase